MITALRPSTNQAYECAREPAGTILRLFRSLLALLTDSEIIGPAVIAEGLPQLPVQVLALRQAADLVPSEFHVLPGTVTVRPGRHVVQPAGDRMDATDRIQAVAQRFLQHAAPASTVVASQNIFAAALKSETLFRMP